MRVDTNSATWAAVRDECNKQISISREYIEASGIGLDETEHHRGRIRAFKDILDLVKSKPVINE